MLKRILEIILRGLFLAVLPLAVFAEPAGDVDQLTGSRCRAGQFYIVYNYIFRRSIQRRRFHSDMAVRYGFLQHTHRISVRIGDSDIKRHNDR